MTNQRELYPGKFDQFRQKITFYLEDFETPAGRIINLTITALVLLSSAIFVAQTYSLPLKIRESLDALNTFILVIFSVEYFIRFWCADHKLKFFFSLYSIIDLVVILPFFFKMVDVSFILLFRWFRILRLIRFFELKVYLIGKISTEDSIILARILFTLLTIIFVFSGLIYQVEHPINPESFNTFLDAVYFSVVTMTTVGFGDVTPISEGGRLMTVLMILTGISLIPWQIGDLIKQLIKTQNQKQIQCLECGLIFHDANAEYCKICGTNLPKNQP